MPAALHYATDSSRNSLFNDKKLKNPKNNEKMTAGRTGQHKTTAVQEDTDDEAPSLISASSDSDVDTDAESNAGSDTENDGPPSLIDADSDTEKIALMKPDSFRKRTPRVPKSYGANRHKLVTFDGEVQGTPSSILIDSGASRDFISQHMVEKLNLDTVKTDSPLGVSLADGRQINSGRIVKDADVVIGPLRVRRTLHVLNMTGLEVVLGKPFLSDFNPSVDWTSNSMEITQGDNIICLEAGGEHRAFPAANAMTHTELMAAKRDGEPCFAAYVTASHPYTNEPVIELQDQCFAVVAPVLDVEIKTAKLNVESLDAMLQPRNDKDVQRPDWASRRIREWIQRHPAIATESEEPSRPREVEGEMVYHTITEIPGTRPPFKQPYRLSPTELKTLKKMLDELLATGFIRPSSSAYGAPVLFVPKPDGTLRMVLDYRELNAQTVKDRYPLPRDQDLFDQLQVNQARILSSLDLLYGYWQVLMHPDDVHKTAIRTPLGAYEYVVMPMGLTNAPATFQRMMEAVLRPFLTDFCMVYLDDIIIYSRTPEEHAEHIIKVLHALHRHGLKIKPKKCELFHVRLKFLGHIIDVSGVRIRVLPNPDKVDAISKWEEPTNNTELQSFIGAVNYYARMIEGYADRAAPLMAIMSKKWNSNTKADFWTPEHSAAFEDLKEALKSAPVLILPKPEAPFIVQTDASNVALGGVLMQEIRPGDRGVVAYFSKKFSPAQRNWPVHERELYGLIHALKKYRHYLLGSDVTFEGDHKPLQWIKTQKTLSPRQTRWLELMEAFNWVFKYVPGKKLVVPDALSRQPNLLAYLMEVALDDTLTVAKEQPYLQRTYKDALLYGSTTTSDGMTPAPFNYNIPRPSNWQPYGYNEVVRDTSDLRETPELWDPHARSPWSRETGHSAVTTAACPEKSEPEVTSPDLEPEVSSTQIAAIKETEQEPPITLVTPDNNTTATADLLFGASLMHKLRHAYNSDEWASAILGGEEKNGYVVQRGIILRYDSNEHRFPVIYVPASATELQKQIMEEFHDAMLGGHLSALKTYEKIRRTFYWVNMKDDVEAYVKSCDACQRAKRRTTKPPGANVPFPIPEAPFEIIAMDMKSGLPRTVRGNNAFWVVVDKLTRRGHIIPCSTDCTAADVAKLVFDNVVRHWGVPCTIISDRDPRFIAAFWQELWKLVGTKLNMSTAEHPQTDGSSERFIGTIVGMVRARALTDPRDWDIWIGALEFAYNDSVHPATGFTPFQLSIGRDPNMPVTMMLNGILQRPAMYAHDDQFVDPQVFIHKYTTMLSTAKQELRRHQSRQQQTLLQRTSYPIHYDPGDYVWLEASTLRTPLNTMAPRRHGPYRVVRKVGLNSYELDFGDKSRRHNPINEDRLSPYLDRDTRLPWPSHRVLPADSRGDNRLTGAQLPTPPPPPEAGGNHAVFGPPNAVNSTPPALPIHTDTPNEDKGNSMATTSSEGLREDNAIQHDNYRPPVDDSGAPPQPTAARRYRNSDLQRIQDWQEIHEGDTMRARVLVQYKGMPEATWRDLHDILTEGGFKMARNFAQQRGGIHHPHLWRTGFKEFNGVKYPFLTAEYQTQNTDGEATHRPYYVVYSDKDKENLTEEELKAAERNIPEELGALHYTVTTARRQPRLLELCCGGKSTSSAIRRLWPKAKVVTLDIDPRCSPTILVDIADWNFEEDAFPSGYFDIIWASPPCTEYSLAKTRGVRDLVGADRLVRAVKRIIKFFAPAAWFIENPHALLYLRPLMRELEEYRHTTTYCQYGMDYRKETDIWTNCPVKLKHCGVTPCAHMQLHGRHPRTAQAGPTSSGVQGVPRWMAYSIPQPLLRVLLRAALRQAGFLM